MGGTFDEVLMPMVSDLVRSLLWERFGSEGWVRARCWVLRGRALIALVGRLVVVGVCSSGPLLCLPVGGYGGGSARTLRTTQWTRASSKHLRVFGEDDLKDH